MNLLITAGNTQSPIDRVRCVTNIFTGRTGAQIARTAWGRGHPVTLVTSRPDALLEFGVNHRDPGERFRVRPYRTFDELTALMQSELRAVLKEVPLWLDEGLAGFFELPPDHDGVNANHLEILRRGPFQPDLTRLERLDKVRQMEKPEYREAWAWVHLMLRGSPEAGSVLRDYLQALRTSPNPGPLLPRLKEVLADPDHELAEHLARLAPPAGRPSPKRR